MGPWLLPTLRLKRFFGSRQKAAGNCWDNNDPQFCKMFWMNHSVQLLVFFFVGNCCWNPFFSGSPKPCPGWRMPWAKWGKRQRREKLPFPAAVLSILWLFFHFLSNEVIVADTMVLFLKTSKKNLKTYLVRTAVLSRPSSNPSASRSFRRLPPHIFLSGWMGSPQVSFEWSFFGDVWLTQCWLIIYFVYPIDRKRKTSCLNPHAQQLTVSFL